MFFKLGFPLKTTKKTVHISPHLPLQVSIPAAQIALLLVLVYQSKSCGFDPWLGQFLVQRMSSGSVLSREVCSCLQSGQLLGITPWITGHHIITDLLLKPNKNKVAILPYACWCFLHNKYFFYICLLGTYIHVSLQRMFALLCKMAVCRLYVCVYT